MTLKVFIAGTSLSASYGGPAVSVTRLAMALSDVGVDVGLWSPDPATVIPQAMKERASSVRRLVGTEAAALRSFGEADILHDNGMWLPHNRRLAALAARHKLPRIVSTRGMLEPWALNHKRWKKSFAWHLYQRRDLMKSRCLHVTALAEFENLERLNLGRPIRMIPNGVDMPDPRWGFEDALQRKAARPGPRVAFFLGRIYPVKGLPMLIAAWARVRPKGWRLVIGGPDQAGHKAEVQNAIHAAGLDEMVSFLGPLDNRAKTEALFDADLFVLPTHSESFGMAIGEALAHGLPVLTTKGAPWPILAERGCGWWVEPTVDGIAAGLQQATACGAGMLQSMGSRGRTLIAETFGWDRIANQYLAIYEEILASRR